MQEIEKELIVRAGEGDMRAFHEIYQKAAGFVYSLAYRVVGRKHDAEEVTQDVFLKLHRNLRNFKFESAFKTWLYRVAVNTALNHKKMKNRIERREIDQGDEEVGVTHADAPKNLEAGEAEEKLMALLNKLNPEHRACIVLREIEGLDYQAIAQSLGININTVRSRLKRARETLMALGKKEVTSHGM